MKKIIIYWIASLLIVVSCITPYEPQDVQSTAGLLVVEAMILAPYGSTVKLSRTISLSDVTYMPVNGSVKIITDSGREYQMTETSPGEYILEQQLNYAENEKYALDIVADGRHYRSEFEEPLRTPEIETVSWAYTEKHNRVDIMVSVDNPEVETAYYRWAYKENWEILAPNFVSDRWDPEIQDVIYVNGTSPDNRYYCWAKDSSRTFVLGSSEKLVSSQIKNNKIREIEYGGYKLSYLYHIAVQQYALSKPAYSYFRNLQNNVENTGSIFAPQPTEMKGNIHCVDVPEEVVIGYLVVTTEATSGMYIRGEEVPEMSLRSDCHSDDETSDFTSHAEAYESGYGILTLGSMMDPTVYMPLRCVDCTFRRATKNKPEWWPNNHQ